MKKMFALIVILCATANVASAGLPHKHKHKHNAHSAKVLHHAKKKHHVAHHKI